MERIGNELSSASTDKLQRDLPQSEQFLNQSLSLLISDTQFASSQRPISIL
jgi:hypothetical protein